MSKIVENLLTGVLYIALTWGEIGGIYHSVTKHSTGDVILTFAIPPLAWYRSLEFFWHDDFAGVDWNKRIKNDIKICIYFLSNMGSDEANLYKLSDDIEKFSKIIEEYPEKKKAYLKNASKIYINYQASVMNDFQQAFDGYLATGWLNFKTSQRTLDYEKTLKKIGLEEEIEVARKAFDVLMRQMEEEANQRSDLELINKRNMVSEMISLATTRTLNNLKAGFYNLFNEEF